MTCCVNEKEIKEYWINKSSIVFCACLRLATLTSDHLNAPKEELLVLWEKNRKVFEKAFL